jgi:hypothetical protein
MGRSGCSANKRRAVGSNRAMKRKHLVTYNYGRGALWAFIYADSPLEIVERYPELELVHEVPPWFTNEIRVSKRPRRMTWTHRQLVCLCRVPGEEPLRRPKVARGIVVGCVESVDAHGDHNMGRGFQRAAGACESGRSFGSNESNRRRGR